MGKAGSIGVSVAALVVALTLAAPGWAQSRGGFRASASGARIITAPLRSNFSSQGAPGFGLDYAHLAAIDRATNGNFSNGRRIQFVTPVFSAGLPFYYFWGSDYGYSPYPEQQPSVIVLQQPPQTVMVQQPASQGSSADAAPADAQPAAPLHELGQFILLRRDGQVMFAVAFTIVNDRLTYITSEGARRSFPVAELDKDGTRQMNEANGTTLNLPD